MKTSNAISFVQPLNPLFVKSLEALKVCSEDRRLEWLYNTYERIIIESVSYLPTKVFVLISCYLFLKLKIPSFIDLSTLIDPVLALYDLS